MANSGGSAMASTVETNLVPQQRIATFFRCSVRRDAQAVGSSTNLPWNSSRQPPTSSPCRSHQLSIRTPSLPAVLAAESSRTCAILCLNFHFSTKTPVSITVLLSHSSRLSFVFIAELALLSLRAFHRCEWRRRKACACRSH